MLRLALILLLVLTTCLPRAQAEFVAKPAIPLAKIYHPGLDLQLYWVSEKYDGVRAYWNGSQLLSRQGNRFHAPSWFTEGFPSYPLDGELWVGYHQFEQTLSIVKQKKPNKVGWAKVRFMVFDLPVQNQPFDQRLKQLIKDFDKLNQPYLQLVKQYRLPDHISLMAKLDQVVKDGAEGLMLRLGESLYRSGRSSDLLKVKPYFDAEAIVVQHIPGQGKFMGMMGALLVKMKNGKQFKIGTGFTHQQRRFPPKIGALVTYKYHGFTNNGIPRFASFMRIRKDY